MKTIVFLLAIFIAVPAIGQKKPTLHTYDKVVEAAKADLQFAMENPEGELYLIKEEFNISGIYTMDIQLHEKGKVGSIFCKSREGGDIKTQNLVKDAVKDLKFNFKCPKGKTFKFEYTFNFNEQ